MNKVTKSLSLIAVFTAVFALSVQAHADPVSFNSATADLSLIDTTHNGDGSTTYRVVYDFDFTNWDTSCDRSSDSCGAIRATHLKAINFGFGGSENPLTELVSTTAGGRWFGSDGHANANRCSRGGRSSICTQVNNPYRVEVAGEYQWVFDITFQEYVPDTSDTAIRAWFVRCRNAHRCRNAGRMSLRTDSVSVPEPGTFGMLGAGILFMAWNRRRRSLQA